MSDVKIGANEGDSEPPYRWNVFVLDLAYNDAQAFLDDVQYAHMVEQVRELAREKDPTHPQTVRVQAISTFFELKEKGGPLRRINVRVFFTLDKSRVAIVILGTIFKQNDGKTPVGDVHRMERRQRKYFAGDYGFPEVRGGKHGKDDMEKSQE